MTLAAEGPRQGSMAFEFMLRELEVAAPDDSGGAAAEAADACTSCDWKNTGLCANRSESLR